MRDFSWANLRRRSKYALTHDILPLGDFNLPKAEPSDPVYRALTRRGLHLPEHSTKIGSSIVEDNHYDQIAFFPGDTKDDYTGRSGVIDFDGAVFRDLLAIPTKQGLRGVRPLLPIGPPTAVGRVQDLIAVLKQQWLWR